MPPATAASRRHALPIISLTAGLPLRLLCRQARPAAHLSLSLPRCPSWLEPAKEYDINHKIMQSACRARCGRPICIKPRAAEQHSDVIRGAAVPAAAWRPASPQLPVCADRRRHSRHAVRRRAGCGTHT